MLLSNKGLLDCSKSLLHNQYTTNRSRSSIDVLEDEIRYDGSQITGLSDGARRRVVKGKVAHGSNSNRG